MWRMKKQAHKCFMKSMIYKSFYCCFCSVNAGKWLCQIANPKEKYTESQKTQRQLKYKRLTSLSLWFFVKNKSLPLGSSKSFHFHFRICKFSRRAQTSLYPRANFINGDSKGLIEDLILIRTTNTKAWVARWERWQPGRGGPRTSFPLSPFRASVLRVSIAWHSF